MFMMNNNVCDGVSSTQTNNGQQSTTSNGVEMDSQESEPAGDDNISKLLSSDMSNKDNHDQKVIDFTINNSESSTSLTSTNNVNLRILKQEMNNKLKYRTSLNNKNRKYQTKFSNENDASKQNFELKQMASTTLPAQSDSTKISSSFGLSSISSGSASSTNTTASTSTTVSSTSTSSLNTSSELEEGINNNHLLNSVDSNDSSDDETTDEEKEAVDDDNGVNAVCNTHHPIISNNIKSNSVVEKNLKQPSFKHDKLTAQKLEKSKKKLNKIIEKFNKDYDNQLDKISDKATSLISDGSLYSVMMVHFTTAVCINLSHFYLLA
jgi:hypothetical protein